MVTMPRLKPFYNLKDWKHWLGYLFISTILTATINFIFKLFDIGITAQTSIVLFIIFMVMIPMVDSINHMIKLQ